jgi:glutamyl/glutaminyl-tRNA synthetase
LIVKTTGGEIKTQLPESMRDFIVRKKDGFPAYQLASVADDIYFGVDLIVRGEDLWESTLAQIYLAAFLDEKNFLRATFHHHALLMTGENEKMSKSAGATSILQLKKENKTPQQIYALIEENKRRGVL